MIPRSIRWVALLLALTIGSAVPTATLARQDASPTAAACNAPELPPGTPTPMEEMEGPPPAEATPAGEMAALEEGMPDAVGQADEVAEALEQATPQPAPAGTPADAATADEATAGAENIVACINVTDAEGLVALMTPAFLMAEFGITNPYDALVDFEVAPVTVESLGDARTHEDGRLSVDIVYSGLYTPYTMLHQRWYFVPEGEYLKLDQFEGQSLAGADVSVTAEMVDFAYILSQTTAPAGATIAVEAPNTGDYLHELVVLRLPAGATVEGVLAGEVPEEQIEFFGFAFAQPGQTGYLGLTGLEPGSYTLVCFVDVPEGIPHAMRGMVAEFTVE